MLKYSVLRQNKWYFGIIYSDKGIVYNTLPLTLKSRVIHLITEYFKMVLDQDITLIEEALPSFDLSSVFSYHEHPSHQLWLELNKIPIDHSYLTLKQQSVLKTLRSSEFGTVYSYKQLGLQAGLGEHAARFVGNVMKLNPTPLLVPCHRVLKADGSLGQYSADGGPDQKKKYLKAEGVI